MSDETSLREDIIRFNIVAEYRHSALEKQLDKQEIEHVKRLDELKAEHVKSLDELKAELKELAKDTRANYESFKKTIHEEIRIYSDQLCILRNNYNVSCDKKNFYIALFATLGGSLLSTLVTYCIMRFSS